MKLLDNSKLHIIHAINIIFIDWIISKILERNHGFYTSQKCHIVNLE